jgi:ketosteroid isomerase-like protein
MASARDIVERYFDAWTSRDFDGARRLLHDNLSFRGPIDRFDDADALLESIQGLAQIVTGAERRRVLAEGNEVAVVYDLHTSPVPNAAVAEWYRVEGGKIAAIEAFFDARPFAAVFERP